jgi:hypothetical protein
MGDGSNSALEAPNPITLSTDIHSSSMTYSYNLSDPILLIMERRQRFLIRWMEAIIASEVLHRDLSIRFRKTLNVTKFTSLCAMAHKIALTGEFRVYRRRGVRRPARPRPRESAAGKSMLVVASQVISISRPPSMSIWILQSVTAGCEPFSPCQNSGHGYETSNRVKVIFLRYSASIVDAVALMQAELHLQTTGNP